MAKKFFAIVLFIFILLAMRTALDVQASSEGQVLQYATPTPGSDGRIVYIVQAGELVPAHFPADRRDRGPDPFVEPAERELRPARRP